MAYRKKIGKTMGTGQRVLMIAALLVVGVSLLLIFSLGSWEIRAFGVLLGLGLLSLLFLAFARWWSTKPFERHRVDARSDKGAERWRWAQEMAELRDLGLPAVSGLERDDLLERIYQYLGKFVVFDTFAVVFCEPNQDELSCALLVKEGRRLDARFSLIHDWEPLMNRVLDSGKPLLVDAGHGRGKSSENSFDFSIMAGSWLGVPILSQSGPLGAVAIDHPEPGAFDLRDQLLLEVAVGELASAMENADLRRAHGRRGEQLTTLERIGEMIVSDLNLDRTLTAIMEYVNRVFNVEAGSLLLVEGDALIFKAAAGVKGDQVKPFSLKLGQGIAGWVAQNGEPLLVSDVKSDSRHFGQIDEETEFETRSILCVPMENKGRVVGVVEIINPLDGRLFNDDDLVVLNNIANSAVVAIENALLHRETERRLAEVSTLYTLAQQVTSSLELIRVLDSVVKTIRDAFACRAAFIFLLDETADLLEIRASSGLVSKRVEESKLKVGEGVAGKVVQDGVSAYIHDSRDFPDLSSFDRDALSLLVVPLVIRDRVVGALCVDDIKTNAFSQDDERLLAIAGAQAAVAIENASLYEGLKERAERLERAYEELREVDRLKTELVQNISHEVRTPLTFIKGYVELLTDGSLGPLNPKQSGALRVVAERTAVVVRLVGDIITLQKSEIGDFNFEPLHLEDVVSLAVEGARVSAKKYRVVLKSHMPHDLPRVMIDKDRIVQVFDNLLGNAIKFSHEGGDVIVRAEAEPGQVLVTVQDHGIGIPQDKLNKVFDRFFQIDGSMTRRYGGTGLGLAIVKKIVEAHNGKVWVRSELNKGSTFCFTLPCVDEEQMARLEKAMIGDVEEQEGRYIVKGDGQ